jgi:60S ribosome subunit biogenesis protein NIP7
MLFHLNPNSEKILKLATNVARDKLVSVGTCFGKFTKTGKFRLHITALDFLAPYAKVASQFDLLYYIF